MRWKTTLLLLAATVGIGAYISLYEIKQPLPEDRQRLSKQVLRLPANTVTQLSLDLPKVKAICTRSDGNTWSLSPNVLRADGTLIKQLLEETADLEADRILTATPGHPLDLKAYGLDPAAGAITLTAKGASTTLSFGETTAVQNKRYAKLSTRPEVFILSSRLFESADQPTESYREQELLPLTNWSSDALTITTPTLTLALTRRDNDWQITQPFTDRAERTEVNELLTRLGAIAIKRFVDDNPKTDAPPATWGFDAPKATVTVQRSGQPSATAITVVFGKPLPDDAAALYAKRSDERSIYAVPASDLEALLKDPQSLRVKACFDFFTSGATKVEVARGTSVWTIEKTKDTWRVTGSETTLDTARVEEVLSKLTDLRVKGFFPDQKADAETGLASPEGTIAVWTDRKAPQRLFIGGALKDGDRYGRVEGRDVIVQLPALVTELLATTTDQLRLTAPTPAPTTAAQSLSPAGKPSGSTPTK